MGEETLIGGEKIPVLGLGTWNIGGGMTADRRRDQEHIQAVRGALDLGYTHIDTAELYGAGHTEELIGRAIRGYPREKLFITTKVSPSNLRYPDVLKSMEHSLRRLETDFIDLYLIHWPSRSIPLAETFRALNELVHTGTTRYLGVSNFSLDQLRAAQDASGTPIVTNQIPYSLRTREYIQNGVVEYCHKEGILVTAYSPIKSVNLRAPILTEIASRYDATPAQIALAWVLHQPGVITIPKSSDRRRLKENWESQGIPLTAEDLARLDNFPG